METTTKAIACGMTTGIVVFTIFSEVVAEFVQRPETMSGLAQVSRPVSFVMLIGFWKLLGWLSGAAGSHLACLEAVWHVVVTIGRRILTFALAAW